MADLTKRVLDCDDDCEGERGERGERGKRGHRGHRGHDGHDGRDGDTGPTGPTGNTGPSGVGTIAVAADGVDQGNFSLLNFTGAGVTVSDAGGGGVNIEIPGAGASLRSFRYIVGAETDLSDFRVTIPGLPMATALYQVLASLAGVAAIVGLDMQDTLPGDRTTTDFRVVATAPMTAGDQIDFLIAS